MAESSRTPRPAAANRQADTTPPADTTTNDTVVADDAGKRTTPEQAHQATQGPLGADTPASQTREQTFHCGYCGQRIGTGGEHYDDTKDGEEVTSTHAGTLVVADNWSDLQDQNDAKRDEQYATDVETAQQDK